MGEPARVVRCGRGRGPPAKALPACRRCDERKGSFVALALPQVTAPCTVSPPFLLDPPPKLPRMPTACVPDTANGGVKFIRDLYEMCDAGPGK